MNTTTTNDSRFFTHITDSTVKRRRALELRIVRGLIRSLKKHGWKPVYVYDGGDEVVTPTEAKALDAVFAVDDARLYFRNDGGRTYGVLLIGGNGEDIISDWSYGTDDKDGFNAAIEQYLDSEFFATL